MEILELKGTIIKMKNFAKGLSDRFEMAEKTSVNLKINQQTIQSEGQKEKRQWDDIENIERKSCEMKANLRDQQLCGGEGERGDGKHNHNSCFLKY